MMVNGGREPTNGKEYEMAKQKVGVLPPVLTEREAAPLLGVTMQTLANWRCGRTDKDGKRIPPSGPNWFISGRRAVRYNLDDVLAYRERKTRQVKE